MVAPEEVLIRASVVSQALNKVYGQVKCHVRVKRRSATASRRKRTPVRHPARTAPPGQAPP